MTTELKTLFEGLKPQQTRPNLFTGGFSSPHTRLFLKGNQEAMDEEPLFSPALFQPNSLRSISTSKGIGKAMVPRQSFDSVFPTTRPESDLVKLHEKHVIVKKEGTGRFGTVYKCTDLEDFKIKALKVIKYKSTLSLNKTSIMLRKRQIFLKKCLILEPMYLNSTIVGMKIRS